MPVQSRKLRHGCLSSHPEASARIEHRSPNIHTATVKNQTPRLTHDVKILKDHSELSPCSIPLNGARYSHVAITPRMLERRKILQIIRNSFIYKHLQVSQQQTQMSPIPVALRSKGVCLWPLECWNSNPDGSINVCLLSVVCFCR